MKFINKKSLLILFVIWVLFFWGILAGDYFLWEDLLYQFYPFRFMGADSFSKFGLLFWNPYIFGGVPFIDNVQIAQFYPTNILLNLYCLITGELSYKTFEVFVLLHNLIASISTYIAFKLIKKSELVALFGSIIFSYSSFVILHTIHLSFTQTMLFSPLIVALIIRYNKKINFKIGTWISILIATSFLGGYAQYLYYFSFFILGLFIYLNLEHIIKRDFKKVLSKLSLFLFIIVGGIISLVQWLPAMDMVNQTRREKLTLDKSQVSSVAPKNLVKFLVPNFFGITSQKSAPIYYDEKSGYIPYWAESDGGYEYWETALYFGIIPVALLLFYLLFVANKREKIFYTIFLLFLILLAMGKYTPLYKIVFNTIPGVDKFRNAGRFSFYITLFVSFVLILNLERILDVIKSSSRRKIVIATLLPSSIAYFVFMSTKFPFPQAKDYANYQVGLAALYSIVLLVGLLMYKNSKINKTRLIALISLFTIIDLYVANHDFVLGKRDGDRFFNRGVNTSSLKDNKNPFRITTRNSKGMLLPRNAGMVLGIETTEGYDPLMLKTWLDYWFNINWKHKKEIFNVGLSIDNSGKGLISLKQTFPRFFLTKDIYKSDVSNLKKFPADSLFEQGKLFAIIDNRIDVPVFNNDNRLDFKIKPLLNKYRPDNYSISVKSNSDAVLVNNSLYYKNWKVFIDGKMVNKFMVNGVAIGVIINAGEHVVKYVYSKKIFYIGLILSFFGVLLLFLFRYIFIKKQSIIELNEEKINSI